ncbi:hypothetical protein [Stenotrophomonas sp. PS02298]|uniref:hypothetical protein n=1 Tax=Stenotrophomonas sp. PS02298 TaxID=2991424 RepID=UPI002499F229|nr:hypothetical protein [Stenotrophomonas sp. PS02298]
MTTLREMRDSCPLSRMAGERAFKARGPKAPLIRPSGTFSRLREKDVSSSVISASGAVS